LQAFCKNIDTLELNFKPYFLLKLLHFGNKFLHLSARIILVNEKWRIIMPEIKIDIRLTDSTTEMRLNKPEKLIEIFPEFAENEKEALQYRALAEHFLDTLNRMNKLIN